MESQVVLAASISIVIAAVVASSTTGFASRLASANLFGSSVSDNSGTNASHLADIYDAWDQIRAHPLTGIGVGAGTGDPHSPVESG